MLSSEASLDTWAPCAAVDNMLCSRTRAYQPGLDHHCTLGKPNANRNHLPPSLLLSSSLSPSLSAPYDDLAVPTSVRAAHLLPPPPPPPSPSRWHLRRLGQWRRRGGRGAANGSASRAQNEGSRVKTNDFYFGNQSEEELVARRSYTTLRHSSYFVAKGALTV